MQKAKSIVQKKGQVTLPTEFRQELGIQAGDAVVFELTNEGILIKAEKGERLDRLNQLLAEMQQLLRAEEQTQGKISALDEMIEGIRMEREKILQEKYQLDREDA